MLDVIAVLFLGFLVYLLFRNFSVWRFRNKLVEYAYNQGVKNILNDKKDIDYFKEYDKLPSYSAMLLLVFTPCREFIKGMVFERMPEGQN